MNIHKSKVMKFPIGIQQFEENRLGDWIYVDKTAHVYNMATGGKYFFLSRPRRFGKSMLLSTLEAYFQVLLSAKNQKVSNNVSAVPINRYCGFIFQKVSPPFRQRALLLAVTIQILPVFSSSLSLGIQRRNMGLRSTSA